MSEEAPVRVEHREGATLVVLDRPDKMNALSREMVLALGRIGKELAQRSELRAVVITGAGTQAFCSGADLKERKGMSAEQVREILGLYRSELAWIESSPVPVIAALNGLALGGGLEIALLADLRVAAEHAVVGLPETSLGIIPGAGGTQRLTRIIGPARAKELILLGRRLTAAHALALGVLNRVAKPGTNVVDDTLEWIRPILEGAPIAQRAALAAIDAAGSQTLAEGLETERSLYEACLASEDRTEALQAFAEKRRPVFRGK